MFPGSPSRAATPLSLLGLRSIFPPLPQAPPRRRPSLSCARPALPAAASNSSCSNWSGRGLRPPEREGRRFAALARLGPELGRGPADPLATAWHAPLSRSAKSREPQIQARDPTPLSKVLRPQPSALGDPRRMAGRPWQAIFPKGAPSGEGSSDQLLLAQAGRPKLLGLRE